MSLAAAFLASALVSPSLAAQALDQTMVPRGRLRLQAHPTFRYWDSRFGIGSDGSRGVESLGDDLTDPTSLSFFPGMPTLTQSVRDLTGLGAYDPILGTTTGRVSQESITIDFGGDIGVFDWLTIGVVVPWVQTRTTIDVLFQPDTINGNLGINPVINDRAGVEAFLASTLAANAAATTYATTMCASGPSAGCTTAQGLADRAGSLDAALQAAYGASPFFPMTGTAEGDALALAASTLSADLTAAGLTGFSSMVLATDYLASAGFPLLPAATGAGIDAAALGNRKSLWATGDIEVSARIKLLDNLTPSVGERAPSLGYRVMGRFLARLPTGIPEAPDVLLDTGTGDGQTDFEGGLAVRLEIGTRLGLSASGFYGRQGSTRLTKRVAVPELAMPLASTSAEVVWTPGRYHGLHLAPAFHVNSVLTLAGEYRFFRKRRDSFALVSQDPTLDPTVLEIESGMKVHEIGGGLRYDTVEPWLKGEASSPMEIHLRLLHTISGAGGQTPKSTRVEAGIRLFRRFWGPRSPAGIRASEG